MDWSRLTLRLALAGVAAGCIAGIVFLQSQQNTAVRTLPADSGRVTYRFTKPGVTGTTVYSWADRGAASRQELSSKALSDTVIGRGTDLFTLDARRKTAMRAEVRPTDVWLNAAEMPYITPASGIDQPFGTGTVLGKTCEIRKLHSMRIWYWEGLPLRMEREASARMQPLSLVATRVETGAALSPTLFQIPSDYQVTDFPRPRQFPWTAAATGGLAVLLLFTGVCAGLVEVVFSRRKSGAARIER